MYGFRYHLVTVIAIFMALGTGILLGGSFGQELFSEEQGLLFAKLEEKYNDTKADNAKWAKKAGDLTKLTAQFDQLLRETSLPSIRGKLAGKQIGLVLLDKTEPDDLRAFLELAGARIQSVTVLKNGEALFDNATLPVIAGRLEPAPFSNNSLLTYSAREVVSAVANGSASDWVSFMQKKGWVAMERLQQKRPDAIVIIGGSSKPPRYGQQEFELALCREIARQKIRVVGTERADAEFTNIQIYHRAGLPTVDNIDQFVGQMSLLELLRGKHGSYGIKPSADNLAPSPDSLVQTQEVH